MRGLKGTGVFITIFVILSLIGCSGGNTQTTTPAPQTQTASVFTIGTDAPAVPSVVSCEITITGVTLNNGTTNVPVMTETPQVIDFAQWMGLHNLMDLNTVTQGQYQSATVTLANPVIGYIDMTQNPPAMNTINGTLTQTSVTVPFASQVQLNGNDLVGLRMEFDLRKSLLLNSDGTISGQVNPTFQMQLLAAGDSNVSIDDFHAGFVGTGGSNTFTVQGPHSRQWTVQTDANTVWDDPDDPISSWTNNTILSISGQLDPVTKDIDASEVQVVSDDGFVLGGLFTYINPPSPQAATTADVYTRYELPDITGIQPGQVASVTLDGTEKYRVGNIVNPLTVLVFNNTALAPGQRVDVGGTTATSNGVTTLTPHRVVLRRQGQWGGWVVGSTNVQSGNQGSFQLNDQSTAGVLLPNPLTVFTTNGTLFVNLSGLSGLSGTSAIPLRVVGFVLENPQTNQPVMVARVVEQVNE
jgi:Domain of unknown function (DUF5666)